MATTSVSICKTGIILIVHKQTSALNGLHVANNYIVTVSERLLLQLFNSTSSGIKDYQCNFEFA